MPPLRAAIEEFAKDGYGSKTIIYTGDLAGHYMPGTSIKLNHDGCTTAHAVVKSTIDELNVPSLPLPPSEPPSLPRRLSL